MFYRVFVSVLLASSPAIAGVTVSSPVSGSTNTAPVHFVAQAAPASSTQHITFMRIYVDNVSVYGAAVKSIDTNLAIASGSHSAVVQAWDSAGTAYKSSTLSLTVKAGSVIPSTATVFSQVEDRTNWQSCDACAGANGNGPATPHWMAQFQTTPSLDGSSAEFFVGGIWDTTLHWQDTGVSCTAAQTAKVWHSLRWEFERTSGDHMHFIAVTVDGVRRSINRYYSPKASSVRELNVAFQMDGNNTMTDYHVWVDKIKLSAW